MRLTATLVLLAACSGDDDDGGPCDVYGIGIDMRECTTPGRGGCGPDCKWEDIHPLGYVVIREQLWQSVVDCSPKVALAGPIVPGTHTLRAEARSYNAVDVVATSNPVDVTVANEAVVESTTLVLQLP